MKKILHSQSFWRLAENLLPRASSFLFYLMIFKFYGSAVFSGFSWLTLVYSVAWVLIPDGSGRLNIMKKQVVDKRWAVESFNFVIYIKVFLVSALSLIGLALFNDVLKLSMVNTACAVLVASTESLSAYLSLVYMVRDSSKVFFKKFIVVRLVFTVIACLVYLVDHYTKANKIEFWMFTLMYYSPIAITCLISMPAFEIKKLKIHSKSYLFKHSFRCIEHNWMSYKKYAFWSQLFSIFSMLVVNSIPIGLPKFSGVNLDTVAVVNLVSRILMLSCLPLQVYQSIVIRALNTSVDLVEKTRKVYVFKKVIYGWAAFELVYYLASMAYFGWFTNKMSTQIDAYLTVFMYFMAVGLFNYNRIGFCYKSSPDGIKDLIRNEFFTALKIALPFAIILSYIWNGIGFCVAVVLFSYLSKANAKDFVDYKNKVAL